ncbi:MAG: ComEC/Rec2 family competence protein [Candidatus Pacebacteria bacterium]|nr:ComEC/Rec2 family competence protein [Candidatus Paceibacterota bacterium]
MDEKLKTNIILVSLFLLVLANVFVWQFVFSLDNNLKVVFFDVGQGDSIFIETPQGHQILIDGGPGKRVSAKLGRVMPFWDRSLDLVVLTHPEYDHLSGLIEVLRRYEVKNILWTGIETSGGLFEQWQKALAAEKARVVFAHAGETIKAGNVFGFILSPREDLSGRTSDKGINETSVVLSLVFGANGFLFTGDIGEKTEKALLNGTGDIGADVLKVAHHGSKYSSSKEFLSSVAPRLAVISCGANNSYGHPNKEVLSNLLEFGITVLRTDQKGDITITSDGSNFKYKNK